MSSSGGGWVIASSSSVDFVELPLLVEDLAGALTGSRSVDSGAKGGA